MKLLVYSILFLLVGCADNRVYHTNKPTVVDGVEIYGVKSKVNKPYREITDFSAEYKVLFQDDAEFAARLATDARNIGGNGVIISGSKGDTAFLNPIIIQGKIVWFYDPSTWEIELNKLIKAYVAGTLSRDDLVTKIMFVIDDFGGTKPLIPNEQAPIK